MAPQHSTPQQHAGLGHQSLLQSWNDETAGDPYHGWLVKLTVVPDTIYRIVNLAHSCCCVLCSAVQAYTAHTTTNVCTQ
jgi:hypothetical protein